MLGDEHSAKGTNADNVNKKKMLDELSRVMNKYGKMRVEEMKENGHLQCLVVKHSGRS